MAHPSFAVTKRTVCTRGGNREMGPARRAEMGIADTLVRVSVGIEDQDDLIEDFRRALG